MTCRALDLKGTCDDDDCGGSEMSGIGMLAAHFFADPLYGGQAGVAFVFE